MALVFLGSIQASAAVVPNPRSADLFEADPALRAWALARFDSNRDGWLSLFEAQQAADAFRSVADRDRDGRVTVAEYRSARSRLGTQQDLPAAVSSPSR